jgi:hypothetical protein
MVLYSVYEYRSKQKLAKRKKHLLEKNNQKRQTRKKHPRHSRLAAIATRARQRKGFEPCCRGLWDAV